MAHAEASPKSHYFPDKEEKRKTCHKNKKKIISSIMRMVQIFLFFIFFQFDPEVSRITSQKMSASIHFIIESITMIYFLFSFVFVSFSFYYIIFSTS